MRGDDGYEIRRGVIPLAKIENLRAAADDMAAAAGSACVRNIRQRSDIFARLAVSKSLLDLLPAGMTPVRSILFDKTPGENWPVAWHQDLTIAVSDSSQTPGYGPWTFKDGVHHVHAPAELLERMITLRLHLDETPAANGALIVAPGSHRFGKIPADSIPEQVRRAVICECHPGDVLLMSPLLLHSSKRSLSPSRRRVVHFEYAFPGDLPAGLAWHESAA